ERPVLRLHQLRKKREGRAALSFRPKPQRQPASPRGVRDRGRRYPGGRVPGVPRSCGADDPDPVAHAADAAVAEPHRPGGTVAADAAHDALDLAADDRLLRHERSRRPGPVLVCRKPRQYHSAELRRRLEPGLARSLQNTLPSGAFGASREERIERPEGPEGPPAEPQGDGSAAPEGVSAARI